MKTFNSAVFIALATLSFAACGDRTPPVADNTNTPDTMIGKAVKKATDQARKEIAEGNIDFSATVTGLPDAVMTPEGDFIIGGKTVAMTAEQRTVAMAYRKEIAAVAEAGIAVGIEGADLAGKAIKESIKGILRGDEHAGEQRIEAEAENIELAAQQICNRLPALLDAQNKLVASVPEFKPYAKMDDSDVRDCNTKDIWTDQSDEARSAKQAEIRDQIRDGIRQTVRGSVQAAVGDDDANAAEEAEAAGAETMSAPSAEQKKN